MIQIQKLQWYDRASFGSRYKFSSVAYPLKVVIFVQILQAAVFSLGLIGAGNNNARIAGMLRNLSSYYYKDATLLFCVMLLLNKSSEL
jgi:hypothetical protein